MKYHGSSSKIRTEIEEGEPVFHIAVTCKVGIAEMEDSLEKAMTKEFYSILEEKNLTAIEGTNRKCDCLGREENQCDISVLGMLCVNRTLRSGRNTATIGSLKWGRQDMR